MTNITFEIIEQVGVLKINRPNYLNALNKTTIDELDSLVDTIKKSSDIKVLIIGSDGNFAAGADINKMVDCNEEQAKAFSFSKAFREIELLEIPTVAAIEGYALGGGLELALACDFRIASATAKLGFPEINLGIMPGAGGTIRLSKLTGISKAKELIFFGEIISADKAAQFGIINKVVDHGQSMEEAIKWAGKLRNKAAIALRTAKKTIEAGSEEPRLDYALGIEEENWAHLFSTEDQKEGMKAFIEKRKPKFMGK